MFAAQYQLVAQRGGQGGLSDPCCRSSCLALVLVSVRVCRIRSCLFLGRGVVECRILIGTTAIGLVIDSTDVCRGSMSDSCDPRGLELGVELLGDSDATLVML